MTGDGWHLALTDPAPVGVPVLCMGISRGVFLGERAEGSPEMFRVWKRANKPRRCAMWHELPELPDEIRDTREYR